MNQGFWDSIKAESAPRANDPETGLPFPKQDLKWKMANFFLEKWGRKLTMKILQAAQPVITIIVGHIANTPESEQVIAIAIGAAILGVIDMVISWITGGKMQSLQKIQEEAEADDRYKEDGKLIDVQGKSFIDTHPTQIKIPIRPRQLSDFVRPPLPSKEIPEAKDIVPPGIWIVGVRDPGSPHEFRKPFGSIHSAKIYRDRCSEIYEGKGQQAESFIYEPGDEMPMTKQYD